MAGPEMAATIMPCRSLSAVTKKRIDLSPGVLFEAKMCQRSVKHEACGECNGDQPPAQTDTPMMTAYCLNKSASPVAQLKSNVPRPQPKGGEALIRVLRAGICGTDLAMINNYKPGFEGALGHEFVGVVERVGPSEEDTNHWIGKRVVGEINIPCEDGSKCHVCRRYQSYGPGSKSHATTMHRNHCPHREALGILGRSGAFAQFITLPCANLLEVPASVTDEEAVFTEPLAAAYRIIEQQIITQTDTVAVLGDGRLGLLIAEVIAVEKVAKHVTLIGRHAAKLALVCSIVDATNVHHNGDVLDRKFDVVVECTGSSSGISMALSAVRIGGRVIMKSTCAQPRSEISKELLAVAASKRVAIIGSRCGPFEPALRALEARRVDVTKYIAAVFPLREAVKALDHAAQRGMLKVQLDFTG